MLGLVNAAPETPAQPAVEALNALFDIYSDAEFSYDKPVFIDLGFNKYLEEAIPKIRTLVCAQTGWKMMKPLTKSQTKRIDRKKFTELRERADEALLNLTRFIAYKKKEQTQEE